MFEKFLVFCFVGGVVFVGFVIYKESTCLHREDKPVFHPQWVQIIHVGETTVPVIHPAYTAVEPVCVEYSE